MQLSNSEIETIRLNPQQTELYLSVFQPTTALACQVNGVVAKGAYQIPYTSVSSGSYLSVENGMTLLVGTTVGGRELGKIRVRSATNTHIIVSENSTIDWSSAIYLTVLRYWEIWPVYPRIISDPNNVESVIFYKDYDIAYTNQNSILGAFPCAGSHLAGWVGDSFYFTSTGTTHLLGSALTHDWAFEGATVTGSTSAHPGNITWNTPGHYVVRYKATGANGSVDTTYRYVSIYNRPSASSSNIPILKWELDTVSGGRDEGGYSATMRVIEENLSINEGDVVVLFSDNWYGSQNISLGGNSHNPSIFFSGHVLNNTIHFDYKKRTTEFEVGSITALMKIMEGFSVSVESKVSPTTWYELLDMDGRRALYHYLRWHSTVLSLADFQFMGTDQKIQYFDSDRTSIFDAIDNYMRGTLEGQVVSDLQGKVWAEVGAYATSNPTGSFPTVMTITKRDWLGEPTIVEKMSPTVSLIERGGVAFSGVITGTFSALLSSAPGAVPGFRGNEDKSQGMALASQTQLNELTGNLYANKNAQFPEISMDMSGNYRNLDIAPLNSVGMVINPEDTNRNIYINAPYLVDKITWQYSPKNKILLNSVEYISLLNGVSGETITIPDVQTVAAGGGFNVPNTRIPTINPLVPISGNSNIAYWGARLLNANTSAGTYTGSFYNFPAGVFQLDPSSDTTLVLATLGTTPPTILTSGLYLVVAAPVTPIFSVTTLSLIFTAPNGFISPYTMKFKDATFNQIQSPFVRPIYFTAGDKIKFDVAYTGGTPDPSDTLQLDLFLTRLS